MSTPFDSSSKARAGFEREDPPWIRMGVLLSLDLTVPYVQHMGLPLVGDAVRDALRVALGAITEEAEDPARWPVDVPSFYFASLRETAGEEAPRIFERWAHHTFIPDHSIHPQWSGWMMAIKLSRSGEHAEGLHLPKRKLERLYAGFEDATDVSAFDVRMERERGSPFSDWDVLMMARHDLDPSYRPADPFLRILDIVKMHAFQCLARRFEPQLDDVSRERLRLSANEVLTDIGIWMPDPLVNWRDLEAGPTC